MKNNKEKKAGNQQYTRLVNNIITENKTTGESKKSYYKNSIIYAFAIISIFIIIVLTVVIFVFLFKN
ncbi:hypothetical protein MCANUFG4_02511 [Mycoplasmopsis canis UFG4]|uniref:Uncharacterized protein n=2 Tax=Mycoplasmopsis canis TaxID=29555 RepID=I1A5Z0_9BACT|nr:hypothetical protein [Mycoplasmopsis canis]AKF40911.1 hypothetical protein AAW50_00410 [Mycoplasmopsis canis]AMD81023.1 hypothetical protein AXW82_00375 [Mycoplasmopsis canis PG 14]EIE39916.1 hypothetical protein MCANPG14_02581 [Mycoplasmopsis canis PG 14]EIE40131.1 hypothetical protein MCANUF31_02521 [Mycoplasmopsis canis UF31]EIE40343.1 hypothetical protein MCANUF33_02506 [Mycoplasmopsis canis UF33]